MIKKVMAILAIVLLVVIILSGYNFYEQNALNEQQEKMDKTDNQQVLYSVVDATGMSLDFTAKPQRIMSLNVSIDEVLLDLVDSNRIIALSYLADDKSICSAGDKVNKVAGRATSKDLETLIYYQPDLVLVPDYDVDTLQKLRRLGLKVYACKTPSDMQGIFAFIEQVGSAVGEDERSGQMVKAMKAELKAIHQKILNNVPEDKRLTVAALSFNGVLGKRGTFNDLCYWAGVNNCFADEDVVFEGVFPKELLLEKNPDIIITPSWDFSKNHDPEAFKNSILNDPAYNSISAIKQKKVGTVHDNYLYSTSQYVVYAVKEIAQFAYPNLIIDK